MLGQHSVNRWELRSCARKGHITYAPDDAALAELMFGWTREVITDWLPHDKPYLDDGLDLFPSERDELVAENTLLRRFRRYCNDLEVAEFA